MNTSKRRLAIALVTVATVLEVSAQNFQFDTSRIEKKPSATLPALRLKPGAFETTNILRAFAGTTEQVERRERIGPTRLIEFTKNWRVERDPIEGALLVAHLTPAGENVVTTPEGARRQSSVQRLSQFGIPSTEVGRVITKNLVTRDLDANATQPGDAKLLRYKTFIMREINGIPVEGHRAVISQAPSGAFHRANLVWPATAPTGHRLTTRLTTAEITKRAEAALVRENVNEGSVLLRWKYVPVKQQTGAVTLQLMVGARIKPKTPAATEAREINVPVDAQ